MTQNIYIQLLDHWKTNKVTSQYMLIWVREILLFQPLSRHDCNAAEERGTNKCGISPIYNDMPKNFQESICSLQFSLKKSLVWAININYFHIDIIYLITYIIYFSSCLFYSIVQTFFFSIHGWLLRGQQSQKKVEREQRSRVWP